MKHCPQCQTAYTDDTLKFCKRDGTPLLENAGDTPTAYFDEEATVISSRQVEPIHVPITNEPPPQQNWQPPQQSQQQNWQQTPPPQQQWQQSAPLPPAPQHQQPQIIVAPPVEKKSKTGLAVALTALGMLALFGLFGVGAFLYMRDRKTEVAVNVNNAPAVNRSPTANVAAIPNANVTTATATPTAKPTLDPNAAKAVTENVGNVIDGWADSTENLSIDAHMNQYADTVDYYKAGRVSAARVRADRERAFQTFDQLTVNISNLKITPDASGERATAVFDKEWSFEGNEKFSSGKVQQQLTFAKIGGTWKITGEKDLKLYYKE